MEASSLQRLQEMHKEVKVPFLRLFYHFIFYYFYIFEEKKEDKEKKKRKKREKDKGKKEKRKKRRKPCLMFKLRSKMLDTFLS